MHLPIHLMHPSLFIHLTQSFYSPHAPNHPPHTAIYSPHLHPFTIYIFGTKMLVPKCYTNFFWTNLYNQLFWDQLLLSSAISTPIPAGCRLAPSWVSTIVTDKSHHFPGIFAAIKNFGPIHGDIYLTFIIMVNICLLITKFISLSQVLHHVKSWIWLYIKMAKHFDRLILVPK